MLDTLVCDWNWAVCCLPKNKASQVRIDLIYELQHSVTLFLARIRTLGR